MKCIPCEHYKDEIKRLRRWAWVYRTAVIIQAILLAMRGYK